MFLKSSISFRLLKLIHNMAWDFLSGVKFNDVIFLQFEQLLTYLTSMFPCCSILLIFLKETFIQRLVCQNVFQIDNFVYGSNFV